MPLTGYYLKIFPSNPEQRTFTVILDLYFSGESLKKFRENHWIGIGVKKYYILSVWINFYFLQINNLKESLHLQQQAHVNGQTENLVESFMMIIVGL